MNPQQLSEYIDQIIQQFLMLDSKSNYRDPNLRQQAISIGDNQYFIDKMSQYALYQGKTFVLCNTHKVREDQPYYIVATVIENTKTFKPLYLCTQENSKKIINNQLEIIQENDLSEIENLINEINTTLLNQLTKQLENLGNKTKANIQKKLEENKLISEFLEKIINQENIIFKLIGIESINPLTGPSILQLIDQYLEQLKQQLQPHELLNIEAPRILIDLSPELLSIFENLSSTSQNHINQICHTYDDSYITYFHFLKKKIIHNN